MRVCEFISKYCSYCDDFDVEYGCECYANEECDEAHAEKWYRGKSMQARIDDYCLKRTKSKKHLV